MPPDEVQKGPRLVPVCNGCCEVEHQNYTLAALYYCDHPSVTTAEEYVAYGGGKVIPNYPFAPGWCPYLEGE